MKLVLAAAPEGANHQVWVCEENGHYFAGRMIRMAERPKDLQDVLEAIKEIEQ